LEVSLPRIVCTTSPDNYARFDIEPLERGYGVTIGNALRRVLLSSLPGAAITAVQIDGIRHEFSDIPGSKEDVTEFILNLKRVRLRSFSDEPVHLALDAHGDGPVTAGDIRTSDLVEIMNPDQHLAMLDTPNSRLAVEVVVERGRGYHDISDLRDEAPIGRIPVDGIYSPVERVNFSIEHTRVGQMTNFERLILDVWTDGTTHPNDALTQAAGILTEHFQHLASFGQELWQNLYAFRLHHRDLCLRPEYTASICRLYLDHYQQQPLPLRFQYAGPIFRYEAPGRELVRVLRGPGGGEVASAARARGFSET